MSHAIDVIMRGQEAAAKALLKGLGYVVLPKERRVIVQARWLVSPHELERSRDPRFEDMMRAANLRSLITEADQNGLVIHERQELDDPITGREVLFNSAIGIIKPKESE